MLHELMLYKPFRDISELQKDTLKQYEEREPTTGKRKIDLVQQQEEQQQEEQQGQQKNMFHQEKVRLFVFLVTYFKNLHLARRFPRILSG